MQESIPPRKVEYSSNEEIEEILKKSPKGVFYTYDTPLEEDKNKKDKK